MEAITRMSPQSHQSEPTHLIKSASRLAQNNADIDSDRENEIPQFSVELAPSPSPAKQRIKTPSSTPSKLSIRGRNCIPLHELLLLSPPVRKSKTRLSDRADVVDDAVEPRRRCKTRGSSNALPACASPRNLRRSRRRIEHEEREYVQMDEQVKPRKRRQSGKSRKEKSSSVPSAPASVNFRNENAGEESALDFLGQMIWDLVMWRDTAKSTLWFGFGCLCFLSSCLTKGLNVSLFSVLSQLGLLFLAASFISNTLLQRESVPVTHEVILTEEDILRVSRVVLPAVNLAICKTRKLFSGEPSTTLKIAILFLFGGEYGHFLTLWRLCTLGFFASFTVPKLYSSYSAQIHGKVEQCKWMVLEAWRTCSHKKIVALSVATAFWNLSGIKTRVFAAFVALVILRHYRQHVEPELHKDEVQPERQAVSEEPAKEVAELAPATTEENGVENKIKE